MNSHKLKQALDRLYTDEGARIVFWNDPGGEFESALADLDLPGVTLVRLDQVSHLQLKLRLEREQPMDRFLLYLPAEPPAEADDWLLDIRLYSRSFRADRASIILDKLGLGARQALRPHIAQRRAFFDSQERLRKLRARLDDTDLRTATELDLDRKMLAVLTRAEQDDFFTVARALYVDIGAPDAADQGANGQPAADLDAVPTAWPAMDRFGLVDAFWQLAARHFAYTAERPSLKSLLLRIMVSDFVRALTLDPIPDALARLRLPAPGDANAAVFLARWRDSKRAAASYDPLARAAERLLDVASHLGGEALEPEPLLDAMTFPVVDRAILRALARRVQGTRATIDPGAIHDIVARRVAGHWVASDAVPAARRAAFKAAYEGMGVAAELFALANRHRDGGFARWDSAEALYGEYTAELYRIDQLYRHFCVHADVLERHASDALKALRADVEAVYCHWYLPELALAWGRFVDAGLLRAWRLDGVRNQYQFYQRHIQPTQDRPGRRSYVIVSDALRYEVAEELTARINGAYRLRAELSSQLGVLPSYTALGMASLLPHDALSYNRKGEVLVDGKRAASTEQRSAILAERQGVAIRADALLAMNKADGRAFQDGHRVLYIYHNEIDARGDSASTEAETFAAAAKAIDDLLAIVRYVVNTLSGRHVVITADHGFVFTESAPGETDRSKLGPRPAGTVKAKKRYLLGHDLPEPVSAWRGHTRDTAAADGDMGFWIPRGCNRFHFVGGARFVHGGAMLQEIVVPVVTVKNMKDPGQREKTLSQPVAVQVLGTRHRVTTQRHRFQLLQTEAVSERVKPVTLKIALYEGDTPVSTIETLTFDSAAPSMDERKRDVLLTLLDRPYDRQTGYHLILRDPDTGVDHQRVDVVIDRAIADDFNL